MEDKEALFTIKPRFNFIYEMFMPTGRKIRNTLLILIIAMVCYFFVAIAISDLDVVKNFVADKSNIDIFGIFNGIATVIIFILAIKLTGHLIVQMLQYNSISYNFYDDYMEYQDTFLNQHKKTLRYDNIKEVEIRRTVWDRMNGYGMIIIYSNAEKLSDKGLILYSVKNPDEIYDRIDKVIYNKFSVKSDSVEGINGVNPVDMATEKEITFKESLSNKE